MRQVDFRSLATMQAGEVVSRLDAGAGLLLRICRILIRKEA
jgi:hypothetical protein